MEKTSGLAQRTYQIQGGAIKSALEYSGYFSSVTGSTSGSSYVNTCYLFEDNTSIYVKITSSVNTGYKNSVLLYANSTSKTFTYSDSTYCLHFDTIYQTNSGLALVCAGSSYKTNNRPVCYITKDNEGNTVVLATTQYDDGVNPTFTYLAQNGLGEIEIPTATISPITSFQPLLIADSTNYTPGFGYLPYAQTAEYIGLAELNGSSYLVNNTVMLKD